MKVNEQTDSVPLNVFSAVDCTNAGTVKFLTLLIYAALALWSSVFCVKPARINPVHLPTIIVLICLAGSSMSMCTIINDDDFRGQKIRFEDDIQVPFNFGAKDGSFEQFGEMEIIESYSEKYLLCHSIVKSRSLLISDHDFIRVALI